MMLVTNKMKPSTLFHLGKRLKTSKKILSFTGCARLMLRTARFDIQKQSLKVDVDKDELWKKFSWIGSKVPCFGINGNNVTVLTEPNQFYDTLKEGMHNAKKRIVIASLYLGTDKLEEDLVDSIREACMIAKESNNENFEVCILLDFTRGSRGSKSSRTLLLPLLKDFGDFVKVHLYHTPDLRGILQRIMPEKYNETIGLNHIKLYIFDDSFVISGANLSNSYFINRQDRYVLFNNCKEMADFFTDVVKTVSTFSFILDGNNKVCMDQRLNVHPFEGTDNGNSFRKFVKTRIMNLIQKYRTQSNLYLEENTVDTWIYPLLQMGPFGIDQDEEVTRQIFHLADRNEKIYLASGYFNLTDNYMDTIVKESKADYRVLLASPEVNGFYRARFPLGIIPTSYVYIAKQFYKEVCEYEQQHRIILHEYYQDNWTFHAKGIWYYLPGDMLPVMTLIGSSNFGYRSVYRDLECQIAMVTCNENLRQQLKEEHERLYEKSVVIGEDTFKQKDRHVPVLIRLFTPFIKHFF